MTTRVVTAVAVCAAILFPAATAWAQVEHAQRLALEVAIRRAQVRALLCERQRPQPTTPNALTAQLPTSPPVGTAGPVDCSRPPWSMGR